MVVQYTCVMGYVTNGASEFLKSTGCWVEFAHSKPQGSGEAWLHVFFYTSFYSKPIFSGGLCQIYCFHPYLVKWLKLTKYLSNGLVQPPNSYFHRMFLSFFLVQVETGQSVFSWNICVKMEECFPIDPLELVTFFCHKWPETNPGAELWA